MFFDPADWYYKVRSDDTRVFSTARGIFVPIDDAAYLAFVAKDNTPIPTDSAEEIGEALTRFSVRPTAPEVLEGYRTAQASKLTMEVVAKVLFNLENRLRALEGKSTITAGQFVGALKAKL